MVSGEALIRELLPRQAIRRESALGVHDNQYPSIFEDVDFIRLMKDLDIRGNAPELRRTEIDQTDPAGRFRDRVSADIWYFERAKTAAWATIQELLKLEPVANRVTIGNGGLAAGLTLLLGAISGSTVLVAVPVDDATLQLRGRTSAYGPTIQLTTSLISLLTGNSGESALLTRLSISTNLTTAVATWGNTRQTGLIADGIGGDGLATFAFDANYNASDATARRIAVTVLDPATDTKYTVAQAVPKAATPLFTTLAPNYTPTTSELDASNLTFKYTGGGNLTAFVNDGGVIKSLVLGAPA